MFCKSEIGEEQISLVDLDGNLLDGLKPAADIRMHLEVYRSMPDIRAIVHSHPPVMTGFAMSNYTFGDFCMPEAMLDYQEERADWIFQKFEMNPDDYNYAWFYELSSYVGTDAFVTIFDIIDLPAGATSDSYFVNNAMDTVYCVFQDKDAVNYLYEFTKEDDVWQLSKVETRQDEGKYSETQQSYADYEQQLLGA